MQNLKGYKVHHIIGIFIGTAGPCAIEGTGLSATFGKDEAIKIHQENVQKLHSMPEAEIYEEQQKLLEILGL